MLEHLLNKKVEVIIALNSDIQIGVKTSIKGTLEGFDDNFIKLDNGIVISIKFIRFIIPI